MFVALRLTDPVSTGAVFTLTPAMAAIFGWFVLRQVTGPRTAAALAVAALGAIWVIFRGDVDAILAFRIGPGEAIFVAGCAGHALYTPLVRRLNRGEPVIVFTFGTLGAATLLITLSGLDAIVTTPWAGLPPIVWITIAYLAIVTTAGTFWLLQFAAMRLPAAKVMAYTYLVPAFILAWEAALGHGLPAPHLLPGIAATALALLVLATS
jgi:drug/metabolite transporter (DMT)-like permease